MGHPRRRAVCGERIVDNATVVVDGAMVVEVRERGAAPPGAVDGGGRLLCPGLVDSHSDGLAKEIAPRRSVRFPVDYALGSFEGRLRSSGITTIFHGLDYQENDQVGRSLARADEIFDAVGQRRIGGGRRPTTASCTAATPRTRWPWVGCTTA